MAILDTLKRIKDIWEKLPRNSHCQSVIPGDRHIRQYVVCGKSFQETVKLEYVIPILRKFINDYGQRARLATQNKQIDWKAVSHAFRALYQAREVLTEFSITYPLKEAPFLVKVKQGELDFSTEAGPALESLVKEVIALSSESTLPRTVDKNYWERFVCDTTERVLFN